ncbi:GNAT family N-acetyltransferase [Aetokthonos hydrillicola Thurmond2011]|jgi:ribosomal protein S18 acetylase RimI-like enzyme|uniref:GNAT family N-acetyltransferase n=1 Tax=Aetokthonos hydrillicola Thurmond2011 TaxID=2712845 RepID=A0AAP5M639_9CYAN|nr:GNAT family N-acetyltransferase [Aetokthonos hydrillicola]MBO3460578.1 GNAT family N-acetyltransferase [Aetokthonos hydrillicola CCALA 1050]MBW4585294.1 GNAT family N-acetyltransferase [Aetokthonos hydrillicola CCALA 1050]MDR9896571.1 GNAT family N-acetyltransferase [Aetokthonos hydrillicola Thurmond2011]
MSIRSAVPTDIPALLPMVTKICILYESWDSAKFNFILDPEKRYERFLKQLITDERGVFFVAEDEDQLVGFLIATVESETPIYILEEFAFIHDLWVEPEYRRKGIARDMIMQAVEHFRQIGIEQIRLDTAAVNQPARRLFASCGFRISTVEMLKELDQLVEESK